MASPSASQSQPPAPAPITTPSSSTAALPTNTPANNLLTNPSANNLAGAAPTTTLPSITTPTVHPPTTTGPAQTSLSDTGLSTRPRDARTLHMVLSSLGVTAYQERVPLQLLDFAYRYTAGILGDAQHLAAEGYVAASTTTATATGAGAGGAGGSGGSKKAAGDAAAGGGEGQIGLAALRLATASRNGYQFGGVLPKEAALEMAAERNRVRLPEVGRDVVFGVRLPQERFVMTGRGWEMVEEWESEGSVEDGGEGLGEGGGEAVDGVGGGGAGREEGEGEDEEMVDEDGFEQIFGREGEGARAEEEDGMDEG